MSNPRAKAIATAIADLARLINPNSVDRQQLDDDVLFLIKQVKVIADQSVESDLPTNAQLHAMAVENDRLADDIIARHTRTDTPTS